MANTLNFGAGKWAAKAGSVLAYNDLNDNFKPLPFTFTRASTATRVNESGLIESVGSGIPRIDFLDNADGHLLLEPSRTNLVPYSNGFDNAAWDKAAAGVASAPVVTANQGVSPDGTNNAYKIDFDLNGGTSKSDRSRLTEAFAVTNATNYTFSFWIKAFGASDIGKILNFSADNVGGNLGSVTVTENWQRVVFTSQSTDVLANNHIQLRGGFGTSDSVSILLYGYQAEAGSYATSYIPTSGSSVTRAADADSKTSDEGNIIDSAKSVYVEFDELGVSRAERRSVFELSGSSGNNIYARTESSGTLTIQVNTGGVSQALFQTIAYNTSANNKIAIAFDTNDVVVYLNGTQVASDTSVSVPVLNKAYLGVGALSTQQYAGGIKEARLYNTRLSNSELAALTSL